MNEVIIDKKKYVILSSKDYQALQLKAAKNDNHEKYVPLHEGLQKSLKLVRKWAKEKSQ